jgi:hypothetical protein
MVKCAMVNRVVIDVYKSVFVLMMMLMLLRMDDVFNGLMVVLLYSDIDNVLFVQLCLAHNATTGNDAWANHSVVMMFVNAFKDILSSTTHVSIHQPVEQCTQLRTFHL